jgi:hypothetical protein
MQLVGMCTCATGQFSSEPSVKNLEIRVWKTIILRVVLYGCETWSLTKEEHKLRVFEKQVAEKNIWVKEG